MAEYVVEEPSGRSASWRVHERIVRCRDCANAVVSRPFCTFTGRPANIEVWRCDFFWNADELPEVEPDGFCKWGERKESE